MLADDPTWAAAGCGDVRLLGRGADDEWVAGRTEDEVQGHRTVRERTRANMGVRGWRDRDEDMDSRTRGRCETAVLWELKQDGAATTIPSRRRRRIRVLQLGTWEARTRSGTRGVINNGVQTV